LFNDETNDYFDNEVFDIQQRKMVVRDEKENDVDRWIAFYADIKASMCTIPEQACEEYGSRDA